MSFHFVDRIYDYKPREYIRGVKNVTRNEGLFYWLPTGHRVLSPAVVTEALCQLGGWLKMVSTDFTMRPVLLGDELSTYHGIVEAGSQIDLYVEVVDFQDDVVVTKGHAKVDGQLILSGDAARGYMLPLKDFDDPERVRRQFAALYRPDLAQVTRIGPEAQRLKGVAGPGTFDALRFIDGVLEHQPGIKVVAYKNFASCEPYFATHFPYKPCVPGVMLLTFMGEVCQYLVKDRIDAPLRAKALIPVFNRNVRFRKFVEPGDQCRLEATLVSGDISAHDAEVVVKATIFANDNRVMQAELGFRTLFAAAISGAAAPTGSRRDQGRAGSGKAS
jgi:3-hydroxymyristoyl/3-hydroxydecanoyl-(acyl carrier protein) dehydratase